MADSINTEKVIQHWIETSDEDFETMLNLYDAKTYPWALFLGHISVEKLLKAVYVKKEKKHAPYIHNLYRLSEIAGLEFTEEHSDWLTVITTFNLNARYDDYKREFHTLCTADYAHMWIERIKTLRKWIKAKL